jgi:NADPH:quinone reductase-like Zn-dependent oxidoreductase
MAGKANVSHQSATELKVSELPDPVPKDDEYLIEVRAAATNFFDVLQIAGKYQNQPRMCPDSTPAL